MHTCHAYIASKSFEFSCIHASNDAESASTRTHSGSHTSEYPNTTLIPASIWGSFDPMAGLVRSLLIIPLPAGRGTGGAVAGYRQKLASSGSTWNLGSSWSLWTSTYWIVGIHTRVRVHSLQSGMAIDKRQVCEREDIASVV